ncbi:MAG: RNA polymerase sigma factor [Actinomycetota bacterium]|nr:RNA polymerase sigma factor [Actinomycetota bacterium]
MRDPGRVDRSAREAAFTAVFQEHHRACLQVARRLVRDEGLAHEVVQEVFLAWWSAAGGGYDADRGKPAAWLMTVTHHKAVDAVRVSERHRRLLSAAASALPSQPKQRLVEDLVWWELGRQSLAAALPRLTPAHREVLDLAYGHGLTQAEIADKLCIPLGTVKSRTHAALLRLRAALGGSWTPTEPVPFSGHPLSHDLNAQDHRGHGSRPPTAGTLRDDVESCAVAMARIAAQEIRSGLDTAALLDHAAALADRHGKDAMTGLVVALA